MVSAYDDCVNISWAPPSNTGGSRILGYVVEKRKKGSNLWSAVNATDELIKGLRLCIRLPFQPDGVEDTNTDVLSLWLFL